MGFKIKKAFSAFKNSFLNSVVSKRTNSALLFRRAGVDSVSAFSAFSAFRPVPIYDE
jgi:hypothetical protein